MSTTEDDKNDQYPTPWWYHIFGYFIRRDACRLAAQALRQCDIADGYAPRLWSLTVFFETYLMQGSHTTAKDFGPKEPTQISEVK